MDSEPEKEEALPEEFTLLSPLDQTLYHELRSAVGSEDTRYNRFHRLDTLAESFQRIRCYCIRGDADDSLRCLVCGICWISPGEIAINIRHLRVLLNKSKSTINGALLKMQYVPVPLKGEEGNRLMTLIPQLKNRYFSLRLWSVRRLSTEDSKPISPSQLPLAPPPPPPAPPEKSVFDYFPELDFDFYDFTKSPDDGMRTVTIVMSLVTALPEALARTLLGRCFRANRRQLPKLLRSFVAPKNDSDVVIAERRREGEAPGEEAAVSVDWMSMLCCLSHAREIIRRELRIESKTIVRGEVALPAM
jgi:hypothetical protein